MGFQVKWLWNYTKSGCLQESPMESVIQRDINRTFPAHAFFKQSGGLGQDSLYRISKAYSVYDEEIGYVQGLSFLAAALLLHVINILINQIHSANIEETKIFGQWHFDIVIFFQVCWIFFFFTQMPEEQAFSVLVKICFDYELRDLFKQGFEVLHLKFYQLERLMQVCIMTTRSVFSILR